MKTWLLSILSLLFLLTAMLSPAWAVVNGSVEWRYVNFEQDNKNDDDFKASSFAQRYSVMYRQAGLLGAGRLGSWNLGLGAEWAAFDSDIDGSDVDMDSFKVLYDGNLLVAPGGLPFRLQAYSYDLATIRPLDDEHPELSRRGYFRPGITTDLQNGQTIQSGVQFVGGIRNGSYLGRYRESLSKLPSLLIDYRSIYHRDIKAINPTKYRQRDLAFVSLNKKDNWFHYRSYDYKDYIDSRQDQREETILLGTIDHLLKRQWIHLTNWIQISVDGSYTTIDDQPGVSKQKRYDLNLYSTMQYKDWRLANFTHYSRERSGGRVTQYLDIPVYMSNRISPDTNLRGQVIVNRWQEEVNTRVRDEEDVYYSTAKYETNITRSVRIDYGVEAEYNTRKLGDGQGVLAEVEAYSNGITRNRLSWYGNFGMAYFSGEGLNSRDNTDYLENFANGRATYYLMPGLSLEASQELLYGSGSIGAYTTSYLVPRSTRGFNYTDGEVARDDDYWRSQTGLALEHVARNRLSNRLAGLYKYEEDGLESNWSFELEHRLHYSKRALKLTMTNFFSTGDVSVNSNRGRSGSGSYQEVFAPDDRFLHVTNLRYLPNKYWEAGLDLDVEWRRGESSSQRSKDSTTLILLTQRLRRNFYAINGVIRRLADIEQRFDYEKLIDGYDWERMTFILAGNYYPTRILSFGGRFEYNYYDSARDWMVLNLNAGLHFPKFQVDFEYDYGADEKRKTVVQRYEVNVRKTF